MSVKNIKKQIVISDIVGLCVSGLLTNGFCIYVSLVFNDNDDLVNRVLFIISGVVLAVVLSIQSHSNHMDYIWLQKTSSDKDRNQWNQEKRLQE